jgi:hypothetical protein
MSINLVSGTRPLEAIRRHVSAGKAQSALVSCLAVLALSACSSPGGEGTPGSGGSAGKAGGSGGSAMGGLTSTGTPGSGGAGMGGAPGSGGATQPGSGGVNTAGTTNGSGGLSVAGQGSGSGGQTAAGGKTAAGGSSSGGTASGTGGSTTHRDHCIDGYDPDPSDATMKDGFVEFTKSGQVDTIVQDGVISWMQKHVWEEAHFQWHNIRRCNGGMVDRTRAGGLDPCKQTSLVPTDQEGKTPGDGLQFLAMHRHMIQSLKQLFPKHTEQFEGWEHYPKKAEDVPAPWRAGWQDWTGANATNFAIADDPASNISRWDSEGAFGQWLQTTSGLHGALHFKWVRAQNSEHGLGNQFTNIDNYMFWKMHGWIDKVWDRYRAAKGKKPTDQDIKDAVLAQCRHMDALAELVKPGVTGNPTTCTPAPKQTGTFVTAIRPIFENNTNKCTGCHGPAGASAGLTLGGSDCVKSSDIVAALVNKPASTGGQFKLIEPGNPDKSWLYLKVTNKAATAGCTPTGTNLCTTDVMPQGGVVTLTQAEQDALKNWIMAGAPAPQ